MNIMTVSVKKIMESPYAASIAKTLSIVCREFSASEIEKTIIVNKHKTLAGLCTLLAESCENDNNKNSLLEFKNHGYHVFDKIN